MPERKKILLIDDTPAVLHILISMLSDEYDIVIAINGETGLGLVKKIVPDAVIVDLLMPDISGYDVLKALKADDATKQIPVILISGTGSEQTEQESCSLGAAAFIVKPFDAGVLKQKISGALR